MTPEEFRAAGHKLVDWIAEYRTTLEQRPVRAQVQPGEVRAAFPATAPEGQLDFDALLDELEAAVIPGITTVQHPSYFGWFPANASLSSVLGDMASSGIGALGISWESCPSITEVEEVVCEWLRQLTGLSDTWVGTIQDTASTATVVALLAARERASDFSEVGGGLQAHDRALVVYTTAQAHSSVIKAASVGGYGLDNVRLVATDPWTRAMLADDLARQMEADVAAGNQPAVVVASVGTTGTTAFDPVAAVAEVAKRHDAWVHVDAAMAGSALLLPEYRWMIEGLDACDSFVWNPHKWMGTILDTSLFYVQDPEHLVRVFSSNPSYLQSSVDGQVTQYRDWGIPLGRRFRALKLWFQLRIDGVDAIRTRLRRDLANAQWLEEQVAAAPEWELVAPVQLQTVCVRHVPPGLAGDALDDHTSAWADAVNRSGAAMVTPSRLDGRWMVRISIGAETTERHHVEQLWALVQDAAAASQHHH